MKVKTNVEVALFAVDQAVTEAWRQGAKELHIHVHFQCLENYAFFQQPMGNRWKYKGGQTISMPVELPHQSFGYDEGKDLIYRSVANTLAQIMNKATVCEGFVMFPYKIAVCDYAFMEECLV